MKKKLIAGIWILIIAVSAIAIIRPIVLDNARKVKFEDERMGIMIGVASKAKSEEEFRVENLDEVKNLDVDYTGFYDTLSDIEKCKQLKCLTIGQAVYEEKEEDWPGPESKERIQQIQKELDGIMRSCSKIDYITLLGTENYFELDNLNFLKNAKNLEYLNLYYQSAKDYSAVAELSWLKNLSFTGCEMTSLNMLEGLDELERLELKECDVSEAGEIVKLKNLKKLEIENTPLGGNAEQLGMIFENCSNIEDLSLVVENSKLSNLEFLKNGKSLKNLIMREQSEVDYSTIAECSQLESLSLRGCDISDVSMLSGLEKLEHLGLVGTKVSEAKDILKLKNLKKLYIANTPLAENKEQLALIYQQFPNIELIKGE